MRHYISRIRRWIRRDSPTWSMRDGTVIRVADMTDGHLRNAIFMLHRRAGELAHGNPPGQRTAAERWPADYGNLTREADRRRLRWQHDDV